MQRGSRSRGPNLKHLRSSYKRKCSEQIGPNLHIFERQKIMPSNIEDLQNKLKPQSFTDHFDSYSGQIQDFWTKM